MVFSLVVLSLGSLAAELQCLPLFLARDDKTQAPEPLPYPHHHVVSDASLKYWHPQKLHRMQLVFDPYAPVLKLKPIGMHRCLYIPEILDVIFSLFDGRWEADTLARLSRTCRAFHDPAIRLLWRHLPGFEPIVTLLPSSCSVRLNSQLYVRRDYQAYTLPPS
jgi:F-box-like